MWRKRAWRHTEEQSQPATVLGFDHSQEQLRTGKRRSRRGRFATPAINLSIHRFETAKTRPLDTTGSRELLLGSGARPLGKQRGQT